MQIIFNKQEKEAAKRAKSMTSLFFSKYVFPKTIYENKVTPRVMVIGCLKILAFIGVMKWMLF